MSNHTRAVPPGWVKQYGCQGLRHEVRAINKSLRRKLKPATKASLRQLKSEAMAEIRERCGRPRKWFEAR